MRTPTLNLKGRSAHELLEPSYNLKVAIANYLEEITDNVEAGQSFLLPQFALWEVPTNDLMDSEVADIAGDAGYHIEPTDAGEFVFYRS